MVETRHLECGNLPLAVPSVINRHAEEVATRWWRRGTAYLDQKTTPFDELMAFDETIDAHLDGLVESGSYAVALFERSVKSSAPDVGADVFAALMFAFLSGSEESMARVDACTEGLDSKSMALEGVFAWDDSASVRNALLHYLKHPNVRYRDAALAQCHVHRLDIDQDLHAILADATSPLVARALRSAGECGSVRLLPSIMDWLEAANGTPPHVRYWAAWSSTVLGARSERAIELLKEHVLLGDEFSARSLCLLCAALTREQLLPYLRTLEDSSLSRPMLIWALGWCGAPDYLPWLIEQMRGAPDAAAIAGQAFRLITGVDLEQDGATLPEPEEAQAQDNDGPAYPIPNADFLRAWWDAHARDFDGPGPFLLGAEIEVDWLDTILATGEQGHRELAALHRALRCPGLPLIPTHAHAAIQWLRSQQLKEESNDND